MSANTTANSSISKIFNLNPANPFPVVKAESTAIVPAEDATVENDFTFIRKNLYDVISVGQSAVQEAAELASQAQHPKMYEALSLMLRVALESNRELMDMHKKKQDMTGGRESPSTVNNNLILTTAELQRMMFGDKTKTIEAKIIDGEIK